MESESVAEGSRMMISEPTPAADARFRDLLVRQLAPSFRLAALLLGSESDADDAVQEATVAAWRHFGELHNGERIDAWFQRIVVNKCRDRLRRRRSLPTLELPDDYRADPLADGLAAIPERDALRRCLGALRPEHRTVVVLRYFADLSLDEIAERTGERPGTVRSRLHYALGALRAAYEAAERSPGRSR